MVGSLALDSWALVNFSGRVIASPDQVTLSGSGGLSMTNFPLGVTFNGTFTSSLNTPSWSLNGTGRLRLASIEIASARLSLLSDGRHAGHPSRFLLLAHRDPVLLRR